MRLTRWSLPRRAAVLVLASGSRIIGRRESHPHRDAHGPGHPACAVLVDWLLSCDGRGRRREGPGRRPPRSSLTEPTAGSSSWPTRPSSCWRQNTGVDVTSLIAKIGIGGIAVAAIQNILGDLFASLTIAPGQARSSSAFHRRRQRDMARSSVGLKTTHVRNLSGEQLVFGNADLLSSRVLSTTNA